MLAHIFSWELFFGLNKPKFQTYYHRFFIFNRGLTQKLSSTKYTFLFFILWRLSAKVVQSSFHLQTFLSH